MNVCSKVFSALVLAGVLVGCGGGGGGGASSPDPFTLLPAVATTKNRCASPRVGSSSVTGEAFPDVQGSLLDEQNFLAAWTNDTYLWYREVAYPTPANYNSATAYFAALKTNAVTGSGAAKDRFHFTYTTSEWESLSTQGVQIGYGANWAVIKSTPPRSIKVAYTDPGTPASALSPALSRGATVLKVDGVDVVNNNTQSGINAINAGLFPTTAGVAHTFEIKDAGSATTRTVTMTSASITTSPVQNVQTLVGGAVGYMQFNDHIATAEPALINAITQLKNAGVTDLVIDIRYNGGGYLAIAAELAYMVAGPTRTTGKTFELMTFNDKYPTVNPVTKAAIAPTPFYATAVGLDASVTQGSALPHLGLSRVYVLTGPDTCSASEAIMNGLRGAGVQVFQFGSKTCGKPYGFYPQANCGTTYFSIQFKGVNALGFGDYSDGLAPQNGSVTGLASQAILPGCSVADDYSHALGDPAEARLAAALQYRASNGTSCPTPATGMAQPQLHAGLLGESPLLNRPQPLTNRIATPVR